LQEGAPADVVSEVLDRDAGHGPAHIGPAC
jgi:hypothetical protein